MKCKDCEEHEATVEFCEGGAMSYAHGMVENICQCCYVSRIEEHLVSIQNNLHKERTKLQEKGCE